MKFDVVVGNPPYQEENKDTTDKAIYNNFYDLAKGVSSRYCLITPARFLFNAGSTDKKWNAEMLSDDKLKVSFYEADSTKVFPNTDIQGGVAILYRDENRPLGPIGEFTKFPILNEIVKRVSKAHGFESIQDMILLQHKFDLDALYEDFPSQKEKIGSDGKEKRLTTSIFSSVEAFTENRLSDSDIEVIGLIKNKRVIRYIPRKYLESHPNLKLWKVIVPRSNGSPNLGTIGEPVLGKPYSGHTQSFISLGRFDSELSAANLLKYVKTRFARALLGALKVTQHNPPSTWAKVPALDFGKNSLIDWNKSIEDIDEQLFDRYELSETERAFIRDKVKPME